MPFYAPIPLGSRFEATRQRLDGACLSPLRDALPERLIAQAADAVGIDLDASAATIYTPALTLWTYLAQVVSGNGTCVAAVARLMVLLLALGREPCAAHTGAYCKARAKLAVPWLGRLTYDVAMLPRTPLRQRGVVWAAARCWWTASTPRRMIPRPTRPSIRKPLRNSRASVWP